MATRASRLASLIADTGLEVKPSAPCGGEEGLFVTAEIEADTVLFSDVPLCWLPESDDAPSNCAQCGAFIGSPTKLLAALTGDDGSDMLCLPVLDEADASSEHVCPRPAPENPSRLCVALPGDREHVGWEQVQMGAQLIARMSALGTVAHCVHS